MAGKSIKAWIAAALTAAFGLGAAVLPAAAQPVEPGDDVEYEVIDEPAIVGGGAPYNGDRSPIKTPGYMPLVAPPQTAVPAAESDGQEPAPADARPATIDRLPQGAAAEQRPMFRSTGGRRARSNEFPWQVELFQPWQMADFEKKGLALGRPLWSLQHLCGGSLIAWGWVVTAAHCLDEADGKKKFYKVRLGATNFATDPGWTYTIDRVIWHKGYRKPARGATAKDFDIALVHFTGGPPPPAGSYAAILLDRGDPPPGNTPLVATGWGRTENGQPVRHSSILLKVELNNVPEVDCAALWRPVEPFEPNGRRICAGSNSGRQTCQGDSGGPLVNRDGVPRLIGIVGWNRAACQGRADRPGGYARVASFAKWIDDVIGPARR